MGRFCKHRKHPSILQTLESVTEQHRHRLRFIPEFET
jgi:hypothetical protein